MLRHLSLLLVLSFALPGAAFAQERDEHVDKGDYLFKTGYYLKASEHYRLALLDDPSSPWKKLAFGHSLFAIGNYSYASYALRRGVAELNADEPFQPELATLFPSRRAFTQAMRDLKRYVTYSPRDPAGLTVLGYVLYTVAGEERRCRDMFLYLKRLDPNDPFAAYFLDQIRRRANLPREKVEVVQPEPTVVAPLETPKVEPPQPIPDVPPAVAPPPAKKPTPTKVRPVGEVVPPPQLQGEGVDQREWPKPVPALAD